MMSRLVFEEARMRMLPGDVIAFGGSSHFSGIIKMAIRAEVSHIGILLRTDQQPGNPDAVTHYIIDSTSRQGVAISRLQDRIDDYDGEIWWLPLQRDLRTTRFDAETFVRFLEQQRGKKYDHTQAAGSAIDVFDTMILPFGIRGPGSNEENFDRFFCSELVAAGLKTSGVLPRHVNTSEATPIDICRWHIFAPEYYILKGDVLKEISGYNSLCIEENRSSENIRYQLGRL